MSNTIAHLMLGTRVDYARVPFHAKGEFRELTRVFFVVNYPQAVDETVPRAVLLPSLFLLLPTSVWRRNRAMYQPWRAWTCPLKNEIDFTGEKYLQGPVSPYAQVSDGKKDSEQTKKPTGLAIACGFCRRRQKGESVGSFVFEIRARQLLSMHNVCQHIFDFFLKF